MTLKIPNELKKNQKNMPHKLSLWRIRKMLSEKISVKEIAEKFNVDISTIERRLKMMRIERPEGKVGRPIFDGKDVNIVIQKLEQVWSIGGTDKEACLYADISPAALSNYLKNHPVISERKTALLESPKLKARQEVIKGLSNNPEFALKYLERKASNEFAIKNKVEHSADQTFVDWLLSVNESEKK